MEFLFFLAIYGGQIPFIYLKYKNNCFVIIFFTQKHHCVLVLNVFILSIWSLIGVCNLDMGTHGEKRGHKGGPAVIRLCGGGMIVPLIVGIRFVGVRCDFLSGDVTLSPCHAVMLSYCHIPHVTDKFLTSRVPAS